MTLLISALAACITTVIWYLTSQKEDLKLGVLCLMYWGATIMWFVDAIFEYAELKAAYFTPSSSDMLNDSFLGLSVVVFGLIIWLVILLVSDPKGVVKAALFRKGQNN